MDLNGLSAIVTGGASGLGGATAAPLAAVGVNVAIFDLIQEIGQAHAAQIGGSFFKVNVADENSVIAGIATAEAANGVARILINCAGIGSAMKIVGRENVPHSLDHFRTVVRGVIVNTPSVVAYDGQVGQAAYSASKGVVVGMTLPIARDLAHSNIRVMTIAPGLFLTPLLMALPEPARVSLGTQVPHPSRLATPMNMRCWSNRSS